MMANKLESSLNFGKTTLEGIKREHKHLEKLGLCLENNAEHKMLLKPKISEIQDCSGHIGSLLGQQWSS